MTAVLTQTLLPLRPAPDRASGLLALARPLALVRPSRTSAGQGTCAPALRFAGVPTPAGPAPLGAVHRSVRFCGLPPAKVAR